MVSLRNAALIFVSALLPALCIASAAGRPRWSRVDFTEQTHQGVVRVLLEADESTGARRLGSIRIWVNGKRLRLPAGIDLRVPEPQLHEVRLMRAGSVTCIEDDCPDIRDWPATLFIDYGERTHFKDCDRSWLTIDVFSWGIGKVAQWTCNVPQADYHLLYEPN